MPCKRANLNFNKSLNGPNVTKIRLDFPDGAMLQSHHDGASARLEVRHFPAESVF
jgi:hypothetical protein